jgi:RNA polymerase sigma-70 factor (ECF subfamily)
MDNDYQSDEQLIARILRRDASAHEVLFDRHGAVVMGLAYKITGDRALAEEVVQETFWRLWSKADSFQGNRGPFAGWLFRIARNLSIDAIRRRNSQGIPTSEAEQIVEQVADPAADVAEAAWLGAQSRQIRAAVAGLPPEQRAVIEMAYFRGMTRQEIARSTGEPLGTIHTRARLALQKLREALSLQGLDE